MKIKKIFIILSLVVTTILGGCNNQTEDIDENSIQPTTTVSSTESAVCSSVPSLVPNGDSFATKIPVGEAKAAESEREDTPVEYAEAAYFKEKVKEIYYYCNGKKYTISPENDMGKEIISMTKQRYINTNEKVTKKNKLKQRVSKLMNHGRALEIKFVKTCYKIYLGSKSNDYQKVPIHYRSWFYPL